MLPSQCHDVLAHWFRRDCEKDNEIVRRLTVYGSRNIFRIAAPRRAIGLCRVLQAAVVLSFITSGALAQTAGTSPTFEGKARIVDGDTLEIGIHRIDLHGVDAPEQDQRCERNGQEWRCGVEATYAMAALIETQWVICRQQASVPSGNPLVECRIGGPKGFSVNREIVRRGWALALQSSGGDYMAAEQEAMVAKVGLWSGTFVAPWEWRRTRETGKR